MTLVFLLHKGVKLDLCSQASLRSDMANEHPVDKLRIELFCKRIVFSTQIIHTFFKISILKFQRTLKSRRAEIGLIDNTVDSINITFYDRKLIFLKSFWEFGFSVEGVYFSSALLNHLTSFSTFLGCFLRKTRKLNDPDFCFSGLRIINQSR